MKLYTIGFTRKSAEHFFESLRKAGVKRVLDVRLNKTSQLSGFAKGRDLVYLLDRVAGIGYADVPELAPEPGMLQDYQHGVTPWSVYSDRYRGLIAGRRVQSVLSPDLFDGACLLCSEHDSECCHRRVAAEYLRDAWNKVDIVHLR